MSNLFPLMAAAGNVTAGADTDADFANTVLLLNGDGTNGGQNNTFLDTSGNGHAITRNGNVTQGSFSPFAKADGKWGVFFDGNSDSLQVAADSSLNFVSSGWTVECFVYGLDFSQDSYYRRIWNYSSGLGDGISCDVTPTGQIEFRYNDTTTVLTTTPTISLHSWHHIAVVYDGTNVVIYIDGTASGSVAFSNTKSGKPLFIGSFDASGNGDWHGYISNFRYVSGTAVYTANFTVPTDSLTAVANTSLLTCQSNRFIDNSTNAHAITVNGNPKVTPFSPFAPSTAYNPATKGGSAYFDGTGDYLILQEDDSFSFATGDFTIEFWARINATGTQVFFDTRPNSSASGSMVIYTTASNLIFATPSTTRITGSTLSVGTWYHIALSRSGTSTKMFINGTQTGSTYSDSTNYICGAGRPVIGIAGYAFGTAPLNGHISDLRVIKGEALYTSAFTPPTAPLNPVSGTSLLCNFTNASIIDRTGSNVLETVGNAQVDTTTFKYGTGSLEFDGTDDYLVVNGGEEFAFGTGDFTIECWVYLNALTQQSIYDQRPLGASTALAPTIYIDSGPVKYYVNGADRITGSSLSTGTWYHIALSRSGTSTKLFIDGTQSGSTYSDSTNYVNGTNRPVIGCVGNALGLLDLNGYIDDLRVTKGIARYTANFTPPTKALPVIGV